MSFPPYDPQGLHQMLREDVGPAALRDYGSVVAWWHINAPAFGEEHFGEVGRERSGLLRWMGIESEVLALRGRHPGVRIDFVRDPVSCMKHVEVTATRSKLLLVHDADPEALVPRSDYGKTLARPNEMLLFSDFQEACNDGAEHYLGVLFHSKDLAKGSVPACLEIRFPVGSTYAAAHLDLYAEFPDLRSAEWLASDALRRRGVVVAQEEDIRDESNLSIRKAPQVGT